MLPVSVVQSKTRKYRIFHCRIWRQKQENIESFKAGFGENVRGGGKILRGGGKIFREGATMISPSRQRLKIKKYLALITFI